MNLILVVEDDDLLRGACVETLEMSGYECVSASDISTALQILQRKKVDLVISDVCLNKDNGYDLLKKIKTGNQDIEVIMMTAFGTIQDAVESIRTGAIDYLIKPFEPELLLDKVKRILKINKNIKNNNVEDKIISCDKKTKEIIKLAKKVSSSDATVLITGASGTGKEIIAGIIRKYSNRSDKPFVAINCAAIPENMLEALLFGYEKGSFTGAIQSTPGKFELAQDGTILLDEISEMSLPLQAKILRVLQEKEVERLGGKKSIKLNVRIIATTNKDLMNEVKKGNFREDLYYRLNVFPIYSDSLVNRKDDILPLAEHFIKKYAKNGNYLEITESARKKLLDYHWPGNIREMENIIQRAIILSEGNAIDDVHFPFEISN